MLHLLLVAFILYPSLLFAQAALENPAPNSAQSGIGIVSGWKCTAGTVTVRFDGATTLQAAYGTARADTQSICGDINNGFGILFNWNLLGPGAHLVEVLDSGSVFASANITVSTFGQEFLTGQSGTLTGTFAGRQVTMQWSEAAQNFIITSTGNPPATGETGKWQVSRTQSAFDDLPTIDLTLAAESGIRDSVGQLHIPVLHVRCNVSAQAANPTNAPGYIDLFVDNGQPAPLSVVFLRLDGGPILTYVIDRSANGQFVFFQVTDRLPVLNMLMDHNTLAYQFDAMNVGAVETTFDVRGLEATINQNITIERFQGSSTDAPVYGCTPQ